MTRRWIMLVFVLTLGCRQAGSLDVKPGSIQWNTPTALQFTAGADAFLAIQADGTLLLRSKPVGKLTTAEINVLVESVTPKPCPACPQCDTVSYFQPGREDIGI